MKKVYKKPEVKWVCLNNINAVADRCWALSSTDPQYYWYNSSPGYVKFTVSGKNCGNNKATVTILEVAGNITESEAYTQLMSSGVIAPSFKDDGTVLAGTSTPGDDWLS